MVLRANQFQALLLLKLKVLTVVYIYIKANMSIYVCVLLGSGGVFFGVRPVAVINKIKYITCC
jgi:hypothetical protein